MADNSQQINQNGYFDDQTYDVDIYKIYDQFVQQLDALRSYVNVNNAILPTNININSQESYNAANQIINECIKQSKPQESRCHAFYRLIGLPVIDKDGNLYNPGFDKENNAEFGALSKKIKIFQNIDNKIIEVMNAREEIPQYYLPKFQLQDSIASGLALSILSIRNLAAPFTNYESTTEKPTIQDQSYTLDYQNLQENIISFIQFVEDEPPPEDELNQIIFSREHIIRPIMVDPRIDLTVKPDKNIVCVPFVSDKTQTYLRDDVQLKRPLIEKVCRDRLTLNINDDSLGDFTINIKNYIEDFDDIKDDELLQKVFKGITNNSDQNRFARYFNIIRSTIDKLVENITIVEEVRAKYNYFPVPDKKGPEYGSTTISIVPKYPDNSVRDNKIIELLAKKTVNDNKDNKDNVPTDIGGFIFDNVILTPDDISSPAYGDNLEKNFNKLKEERDSDCNNANEAIKKIEMIMGEFSGFGLIDILAVYTALYTLNKDVLVSLLDNNSFLRLADIPELNSQEVQDRVTFNNKPIVDGKTALIKLETEVFQVYNLMEKLLRYALENGSTKI